MRDRFDLQEYNESAYDRKEKIFLVIQISLNQCRERYQDPQSPLKSIY